MELLDYIRYGVLISEYVCDEMGTSWNGTIVTFEDNPIPARTEKRNSKD
jgi:hypothetical protein